MANEPKTIEEIYAERAMQGSTDRSLQETKQPLPVSPAPDVRSTGPVIYGGGAPSSQDEFAERILAAKNKAIKPRKRSPLNVMVMMFLIAVAIVLYVGNVIAVQQLLQDVSNRQEQLQQILNNQEMLKAQINRMSSLERIRSMAESDLGLHNPTGAPEWIEVDSSKIRELNEELSPRQATLQQPEQ